MAKDQDAPIKDTMERIRELPDLKALYYSQEPNGNAVVCSGLITNELKRLESRLASTREKLERYEGLYERAVEDLKDIQNWHGNDYCMRDMAKESLMRLDHYHKTGEALI